VNDRVKLAAYWVLDRADKRAKPDRNAQSKPDDKAEPKPEGNVQPKPAWAARREGDAT
jgi:hypothetical protein